MGGITGCLALADGAGPDTEWVGRAAMRIAHRGPDDEGYYADQDLALGFRRLAVIDTSPAGRQPMHSADGRYVVVFDGEIYNCVELAQRLAARGVQLRTRSCAEVLIEMFAWLGKDVVRQLRGMYAFAIWDRRTRELFCARDPFGIKPFFYALTTGGHRPRSGPQLRFASERKALADSGEVTAIDPDALRRYLSFQYVPAPATLVPPARSLPPGHVLIARPGGRVDVFRYWRPELRPARSPSSSSPEKILAALRDSVAVHLRSDVPVGAFLSGGVDSATLCALAAESSPGLLTFTVGFEREGYSEIDEAMATATALGVKSIPYVIGPEEFLACLPRIVWHLDDPMADAAAIPLWFAAREARRHVKVVLSGEGADELFGGYGVYYQPGLVRAGKALPGWGRATISRVASELPTGARGKGLLNRTAVPLRRRYIGNAYVYQAAEANLLTRHGNGSEFDVTDPVYRQAADAGLDDVAAMQLVDVNTWLPGDILVKADRMAMAHGLELRTPFLDREVLAVAARLARVEKTAAGTTKFALREAVSSLLPQAAAERA
jgi:asparagine synthase (glutamine-hydrolysing)